MSKGNPSLLVHYCKPTFKYCCQFCCCVDCGVEVLFLSHHTMKPRAYIPGGMGRMHPSNIFQEGMIMHLSPPILEEIATRLL